MGLLGDRSGITRQTPVPTNDMTMSTNIDQITSQTTGTFIVASTGAADVGSAAGTIVLFGLDRAPIYNATGTDVGTNQNTSFAFDATDTFDAEVAFDYNTYYQYVGGQTQITMAADMDATLITNGQYMINYETGLVIGKKKDADTTETVTYKTRALTIETTVSSTIDLTKIGSVAISAKNAAFAEPPLGIGGEYELLGSLTADGGTAGDKTPLKTSALGVPYTNLINIAGTKEAVLLEDVAHASGDAGIMNLIVRNDALAALGDTDGDYVPLQADANGALYVQLGDAADNSPIATDDSAQDATPEIINIGGEYRLAETTYTDGDATILQTDVNGYTKVRSKDYDSGTTSGKKYEISPLDTHNVSTSLLDTTNLAAATNYYPATTGTSMDGYKDLSLSGKFIDGDGTFTMTVEAMNDEDTTNGDWIQVYGYDDKNNVTANSWTVTNGTLTYAISFNEMNYKYYRIKVVNDGATNTAILKTRRKAL